MTHECVKYISLFHILRKGKKDIIGEIFQESSMLFIKRVIESFSPGTNCRSNFNDRVSQQSIFKVKTCSFGPKGFLQGKAD